MVRNLVHQQQTHIPLALLPAGTANNIAGTLGISGEMEEIVEGWKPGLVKKFDLGVFKQEDREQIFLEGVGFGLFPS